MKKNSLLYVVLALLVILFVFLFVLVAQQINEKDQQDKNITLNYSASTGGSLVGNNSQTVNFIGGSGTAVEAVPDTRYKFVQWSDGSTENPRTDTEVFGDLNLVAEFALFTCGNDRVTDADGNSYGTVVIGDQCWMAENINVGNMLASGLTEPNTSDQTVEKWCYDNSSANCDQYGGLYSWDEAMQGSGEEGAQGICPTGWHIPSDAEWHTLENTVMNLMGETNTCSLSISGWQCDSAGTALKANRTNYNGTDAVGFNGLLSGHRYTSGNFGYLIAMANYWSSTPSTTSAWRRYLLSSNSSVGRAPFSKLIGFSIRCLKD